MSGVQMAMLGAVNTVAQSFAGGGSVNATGTGSTVTEQININPDGSITYTPSGGASQGGSAPAQWAAALQSGIGNNFWAKVDGTFGSIGTFGSWLSLASTQAWGVSKSSLGLLSDTFTVSFSGDPTGATVLGTFTFAISANRTAP